MARKRKSRSEERQARYETQQKAWERFRPELESIGTIADAARVLEGCPRPDAPGRNHYTNLMWFLQTLTPPGGASASEKRLYLNILKKFENGGELNVAACEKSQKLLMAAIEEQPYDLF